MSMHLLLAIGLFLMYHINMEINKVTGLYFSATGTTEKVVTLLAEKLAELLTPGHDADLFDFTLPSARLFTQRFGKGDLVVAGTPTYAGRVPNVLLPYLNENITADGALAVPVVLFGNRNFDDSLIELKGIMEKNGFIPAAGGAFVGEHSFSYKLAAGRPDDEDMKKAADFAEAIAEKVRTTDESDFVPVKVKGEDPVRPYYTPRDRNGNGIDIRKVKPVTGPECDRCRTCVSVCPMGSIPADDPSQCTGICIKCGACVKKCPMGCKYFTDENYLYHMHELEDMYARRAEPELFI